MSRRDMNSFGPVLENVSFRNTRFDPNQTRFGRLAVPQGERSQRPGEPQGRFASLHDAASPHP